MRLYQEALDLEAAGKSEEAVEAYRNAIRACPKMPEAHFNLGVSLALLGQPDEAVRAWQRAVWLKPDFLNELVAALGIDNEQKETVINPGWAPALSPRSPSFLTLKRGGN